MIRANIQTCFSILKIFKKCCLSQVFRNLELLFLEFLLVSRVLFKHLRRIKSRQLSRVVQLVFWQRTPHLRRSAALNWFFCRESLGPAMCVTPSPSLRLGSDNCGVHAIRREVPQRPLLFIAIDINCIKLRMSVPTTSKSPLYLRVWLQKFRHCTLVGKQLSHTFRAAADIAEP